MTMENKNIRKFRWFWAWQDEIEEAWLREMSRQGLHLAEVGLPGFYTFENGETRDIVYRLDFYSTSKQEYEYYLQLFTDAGWEHVGQMSSWQYFRKAYQSGEADEIYTDVDSKIAKYKRLIGFLVILSPAWMTSFIIVISRESESIIYAIFTLFFVILMVIYAYAMLRIGLRIRELQKK
jgi:hypothetical protein